MAARRTVLVIDDDPLLLRAVSRFLALDCDVTGHDCGDAALDEIRGGSRFDIILCDLNMPGMNGVAVQAAIAALDPVQASRLVLMTGGTARADLEREIEALPNPRITKPFAPATLAEVVRSIR